MIRSVILITRAALPRRGEARSADAFRCQYAATVPRECGGCRYDMALKYFDDDARRVSSAKDDAVHDAEAARQEVRRCFPRAMMVPAARAENSSAPRAIRALAVEITPLCARVLSHLSEP